MDFQGNRIRSAFMERMAFTYPFYRQPAPSENAKTVQRFHGIFGTGRGKPAGRRQIYRDALFIATN